MQNFKMVLLSFSLFVLSVSAQNPPAEQIINRYIESLGGKSAIEKVTSRNSKGTVTDRRGIKSAVEQHSKIPELGLLAVNPNSPTEFKQWFDGTKGFMADSQNRSPRIFRRITNALAQKQ